MQVDFKELCIFVPAGVAEYNANNLIFKLLAFFVFFVLARI
jgi:hypothetical protein